MKLRTIKYLGLSIASVLILASCGIEKSTCLNAYQSGEHLSIQGNNHLSKTDFYQEYKDCKSKYHIIPHYNNYIKYWENGRAEFCSPQSATTLGKNNNLNISICDYASPKWDTFKQAYKQGLKTYWQQQGKSDSAQGLNTRTNLTSNQKQYAEHDIFFSPTPDYKTGYLQGIQTFCTYQSGFSYGSVGSINHQICQQYAPNHNANFLNGYQGGLETNYCIAPVVFKQGLDGHVFPNVCNSFYNRKARLMNAWIKGNNTLTQIQQAQTQLKAIDKASASIGNQLTDEKKTRDSYNSAIQSKQSYITNMLAQKNPPMQQINMTRSQIAQIKDRKIQVLDKTNDLQNQLSGLQYQQQTLTYTIRKLKLEHA